MSRAMSNRRPALMKIKQLSARLPNRTGFGRLTEKLVQQPGPRNGQI
jgi:hypothetical protein